MVSSADDPDEAPSALEDSNSASKRLGKDETASVVAATGRRESFRAIRRQLSDEELASPGVLRLVLENLERADAEVANLTKFVDRFHEADKEAAVLREKVKAVTTVDVMFGVGVGIGGALIGLTPTLGVLGAVVGIVLAGAATFARLRQ